MTEWLIDVILKMNKAKQQNIIFLGDGMVGKTSICQWFDSRQFQKDHIMTVGVDFVRTKHTTKDGVELDVKIWDTAGQEQFKNITYSYYKQADAVIIVFDLTSVASFKSVTPWLQSLYKHKSEGIPKVLCGNKSDLLVVSENHVTDEMATSLAKEHNMKYFKTSAFKGENITEMIGDAIETVYEQKNKPLLAKAQPQADAAVELGKKTKTKDSRGGCCN